MTIHQSFKKFLSYYIGVFVCTFVVHIIWSIADGTISSFGDRFLQWIYLQSFGSMILAWVLIYWGSEEWKNWRRRVLYRKKVPVQQEVPVKKKKKKPKGEIEKLRSRYGGNK